MLTRIGGDLWFFEDLYPDNTVGVKVRSVLVPEYDTGFQRLMVLDTDQFGRMLVLDGVIQFAEADEFAYHEMMAHPALFAHHGPKRILVVGGGDLGVAREALRHSSVEAVCVVDIDPAVTEVAKGYFPSLTEGVIKDPRLRILHEDATNIDSLFPDGGFDVVLLDTTDEVGRAVPLFAEGFLRKVSGVLSDGGVVSRLGGSLFHQQEEVARVFSDAVKVFGGASLLMFSGAVTYYGGPFAIVVSDAVANPDWERVSRRFRDSGIRTRWYSPAVHRAAAAIPTALDPRVR